MIFNGDSYLLFFFCSARVLKYCSTSSL